MQKFKSHNTSPTVHFVTVDAETDVIAEGIKILSNIRQEVEQKMNIQIPITWFVRFQRNWTDSVKNDEPKYFKHKPLNYFDGFELAKPHLLNLSENGDEIGWHYHAYNYVHRDDLPHDTKIEILKADLTSCFNSLSVRHHNLNIECFRFGWYFIPDYKIFDTLKNLGIKADASINPTKEEGARKFNCFYLPPLVTSPKEVNNIYFFPKTNTFTIHDWSVVPHNFNWHTYNKIEADEQRRQFKSDLLKISEKIKENEGSFLTYNMFLRDIKKYKKP